MNLDEYLENAPTLPTLDVTLTDPDAPGPVVVTLYTLTGAEADRLATAQASDSRVLDTVALFTRRTRGELAQLPVLWLASLYSEGMRHNRLEDDAAGN